MAGRDPESHRNEMIKVTSAFPELSTPQEPKKDHMRPVVDKHHSRLHKDLTWRAYAMRLHSGMEIVSASLVGAGCVSTVNPNKHC